MFSVSYLIINILIFYLVSCVVMFVYDRFKERKIVGYIMLLLSFWLSLVVIRLLKVLFSPFPGMITDPDTWEMALIYPTAGLIPFVILMLIVVFIAWVIGKARGKSSYR